MLSSISATIMKAYTKGTSNLISSFSGSPVVKFAGRRRVTLAAKWLASGRHKTA
jgi:hypothetical protein